MTYTFFIGPEHDAARWSTCTAQLSVQGGCAQGGGGRRPQDDAGSAPDGRARRGRGRRRRAAARPHELMLTCPFLPHLLAPSSLQTRQAAPAPPPSLRCRRPCPPPPPSKGCTWARGTTSPSPPAPLPSSRRPSSSRPRGAQACSRSGACGRERAGTGGGGGTLSVLIASPSRIPSPPDPPSLLQALHGPACRPCVIHALRFMRRLQPTWQWQPGAGLGGGGPSPPPRVAAYRPAHGRPRARLPAGAGGSGFPDLAPRLVITWPRLGFLLRLGRHQRARQRAHLAHPQPVPAGRRWRHGGRRAAAVGSGACVPRGVLEHGARQHNDRRRKPQRCGPRQPLRRRAPPASSAAAEEGGL
jgi:hypothetical protein